MHPFGDNMVVYALKKVGVFLDRFEPKSKVNSDSSSNAYMMEISDSKLVWLSLTQKEMSVKDLTYDFENEVFYFFTLAEKTVYRYNVNTGSVQPIVDKIEGYIDDKSMGRIIAVDTENFVFIKNSPFEFLVIDGENFTKFRVPICDDF